MHTLGTGEVAPSQESVYASEHHCIRCRNPVRWMITYEQGRPRAFDLDVLPVRYDVEHTGWAPGLFRIGGRMRYCMAPVTCFTAERQAGIANVLTVHQCGGTG